jgi:tRNA (guanosine-2'-O-)-methyltransferase
MTEERLAKIKQVVSKRQNLIVVLEDIHDPHNAQAVLRSCDAFGVQKVYFIFDQESRFNPYKVGKLSSSSANKWLDYEFFTSTEDCYTKLKADGYTIVATALNDSAESMFDFDFSHNQELAVVLGNEHRGLSEFAINNADKTIMIPLFGMVQSLNLSVTAALFIFEITRQRYKSGYEKFTFEDSKIQNLIQDFSER